MAITFTSCDLDLSNPNAATEQEVLSTKDGLFALSVGMRQLYSTQALGSVILTPSVSCRETAIMTTFANLEELEEGGSKLSGENGYTSRLYARLVRVKGMAEDLIANVDNVSLSPETSAALMAYGEMYRAMTLGELAHNFTHVPLTNSKNNDAAFVEREAAYREAISLLESALERLGSGEISAEAKAGFLGDFDIVNTCRLLLARYQLIVGDYQDAINNAAKVDQNSVSYWTYDSQNRNPVYEGFFFGTISYAPRANFGLPAEFDLSGDGRTDYFLSVVDSTSLNDLPINIMAAPFFSSADAPIPVYRPSEALLIQAEAYARLDNFSAAEDYLNQLRKKTAEADALGIGAGFETDFTANGDKDLLLDEIYKNRRVELFLTGQGLEDSRRFGRPEPPMQTDLNSERNRNFYPFPLNERTNNDNVPPNPSI